MCGICGGRGHELCGDKVVLMAALLLRDGDLKQRAIANSLVRMLGRIGNPPLIDGSGPVRAYVQVGCGRKEAIRI